MPIPSAISSVAIFLSALLCAAPSKADEPNAARTISQAEREFFEKHVRPLLANHCYECHSAKEINGGLRLDSRAATLKGGDSGAVITPNKVDSSLLIEAVRYKNRDLQMPPQNRLADAEIRVLEKWIEMGAPDPREEPGQTGSPPVGMSIEDGKQFWCFQPVASPVPPQVQNTAWIRSPVDAFVLRRLETEGIAPAPTVDRRTLIRRVTYNLIGLPPTPAEVNEFLADNSDDAYEKLVDRLLASPHYGVRWGRHWLDVARYADSNGLDENIAFGTAWRYRDYVVDAFNSDKPFDQFIVEQLAGDLLPNANQQTKTATGFLVLGAKVLAEPDMEKLVMDTIDEQIDATGKVFTAITLGCARCHDHKFDPLKQKDYYALGAIFKSTKSFSGKNTGAIKYWNEHSFATEDQLAEIKAVEAEISKRKSEASSYKNAAITKIRDAARARPTEYLMAATLFKPSTPLAEVIAIAEPRQLHPRILHHCRLHLEYNQGDPFFAPWSRLAANGGERAVEQHYRPLFERSATELAAAKKKDSATKKLNDPELEAARAAVHDLSGFLAVPPKVDYAFDADTLAEYHRLEEVARLFESAAADEPSAMGVAEAETLTELPIHIRGSHLNLGEPVARGFPEVMRTSLDRPTFNAAESGRLELARWLASPSHPLTARVFVNRVWGWHFGRALVASTENFGKLGNRPTHPSLLDWLARHFMESNWSVKTLHRTILLSSTYQMASQNANGSPAMQVDPQNDLLWRFRIQRLEAEQIRDAILATSDRLDMSLGGKTVPLRNRQFVFNHTSVDHTKYDSVRRSLYLPIIRNNLYSLFEQFDFPDPTMPTGHRNATVIAPQALFLMNSPLVMDSAEQMATQLLDVTSSDEERVRLAYNRTLSRDPSTDEMNRAINFIGELTSNHQPDVGSSLTRSQEAWTVFCHSLYASSEFIYVR